VNKHHDKDGTELRIGDRIKLLALPAEIFEGLAENDAAFVRSMVGKTLPIMGFNKQGEVELEFATRELIFHTIWVPPPCVRKLSRGPR
jgi:hypothetical protein